MILAWLMAHFYDKIMRDAEEKCLQNWRIYLLSKISGDVLEIGCGTGVNLDYYSDSVTNLILLEPDTNMRAKLKNKLALKKNYKKEVKILDCNAEEIPLMDNSCDIVVSTLVLCSVNNQNQVLSEINRVLRPRGKLVFIEHICANNNPKRRKWQKRLDPIWAKVTCGCHLTRPTKNAILNAGFLFSEITYQSIRGVPSIVRPSIKGIAIKQS